MNAQDLQIKFNELLDITRASYETFLTNTETAMRAARPCVLAVDEETIDEDKFALDMATYNAAPVVAVPACSWKCAGLGCTSSTRWRSSQVRCASRTARSSTRWNSGSDGSVPRCRR
jgi:hypothetical protein